MLKVIEETLQDSDFREILEKIYKERGFNFSQYKETSLKRRIQRRLRAVGVESYKDYKAALDADPKEYDRLTDVFLINVTEFFRDKEAFGIIKDKVLPDILEKKTGLRIWSCGCSTGEEVYSIAILLNELLVSRDKRDSFDISIYGTDIDRDSLINAEKGVYKIEMVKKQVPEEILGMYFDLNGSASIKDTIKRSCFFKFHDLVLDEPIDGVDLILCRNVAIYFERPLQEKIYMDFYNGLNSEGYLFLGKAETIIGPAKEKFSVIDKRWKIYKKLRLEESG